MSRAVISGMGVVGPHGAGSEALAAGLEEGRLPLSPVGERPGIQGERRAALVDPECMAPWLDARKARRMSKPSRFAVAAARMALADAELEPAQLAGEHTGVSLGTTFGPTEFSTRILSQVREPGPTSVSPFLFMESVANAHAGQVALELGLTGPNSTVTQREAGACQALAQGARWIERGRCTRVLVGAVDELSPVNNAVLDLLGALSQSDHPQPFAKERDGLVQGEGASVLVLESEDVARARGASMLARVRTIAQGFDPSASAAGYGEDAGLLAELLQAGLRRAELSADDIELVVASANGARAGDALEAELLRLALGEPQPPVVAPKAWVGEFGGVSLAAAVLLAGGAPCAAPAGYDPSLLSMPALPPAGTARRTLVSSIASGGAAGWLCLEPAS